MIENLETTEGVETVDIEVARRGRAPGTSGWLAKRLRRARIVLAETRVGRPAAFLEVSDEEEPFALVVFDHDARPGDYLRFHEDMDWEYRLRDWLGCSPTGAAEEGVRELAALAEERLQEWMDSGDGRSLAFCLVEDGAANEARD